MAKKAVKAAPAPAETAADDTAPPPSEVVLGEVVRIPTHLISQHPLNVRAVPITDQQRDELIRSVRAVGVIFPVIVADLPGGTYGAIAGWQRVCAAAACEHPTVPALVAHEDDDLLAMISAVENRVRADMHPVDQWRSIIRVMSQGYTLHEAAVSLGMLPRDAARMQLLARIAPPLLDAMVKDSFPTQHELRAIANAPRERQVEALKHSKIHGRVRVSWHQVAAACRHERIRRSAAVFHVATAGVLFEEDLFAQPGDEDQWTTTDVAGFRAAQEAAINALVEKWGPRASVMPMRPDGWSIDVPRGWMMIQQMQPVPKALPKAVGERQRIVLAMDGRCEVRCCIYQIPDERDADAPAGERRTNAAEQPQRMLTDAGLQMAAALKHQALTAALQNIPATLDATNAPPALLRVLLMALGCTNVSPGGASRLDTLEAIYALGDDPDPMDVARLAADVLSQIVVFAAPKTMSSGVVADEIAQTIGAAEFLPRFDTPEFLAQCSGAMLREAAATVQWPKGQKPPAGVAKLREFLAGKLPDWRPVTFRTADEGDA